MKKLLLFISISLTFSAKAQVYQLALGTNSNVTLVFNTVRYDPNDGGTINVGYINDPSGSGDNDCFMVKLNGSQQIVWQKVIPNTGDDFFLNVIVCANGDYLAVGKLTQSGTPRGLACRVNKTNGSIIWTSKSGNTSTGEWFYDVKETAAGNIAIAGQDHYLVSGSANDFVVLLNSTGNTLWAKVSNYSANSDGAFAINQLPNGNIIVGSFIWVSSYNAIVMELDETTGAIIAENSYSISQSSPNSGIFLNSLWPISIKIINGQAIFNINSFQGSSTANSCMLLFNYNQATKALVGNIYYHTDFNAIGYSWAALGSNDFLIAQSFTSPSHVYVSRVTGGVVAYDKLLNSSVVSIYGIDTTGVNSIYAGKGIYNTYTQAYDFISPRNVPTTASPCSITSSNNLVLQALTLSPTSTAVVTFSASVSNVNTFSISNQNTTYTLNSICGTSIPITLANFTGSYNSTNNSVQLKWTTVNELNSKNFIVERSIDNGTIFIPVGSVNAHGFSSSLLQYNFTDHAPVKGTNLYRLKEVDVDSRFQYSNVVSIVSNADRVNTYYLSPNPAKGYTIINSTSALEQQVNVQVIDAAGRILIRKAIKIDNAHPYWLNINNTKGIYYIKLQLEDLVETKKLVVE